MAISVTVGWPQGASKPSLEISLPSEDAVALIEEITTVAKDTPAPQLQALRDLIFSNLQKP